LVKTRLPERAVTAGVRRLAAEFELLEPLDGFALVRDDLGLPNEGDGHEAHGDDTKDKNKADVGLGSGKAKSAMEPEHGMGTPSTWFAPSNASDAIPIRQSRETSQLVTRKLGNPSAREPDRINELYDVENT
jgi:hypothetical protein